MPHFLWIVNEIGCIWIKKFLFYYAGFIYSDIFNCIRFDLVQPNKPIATQILTEMFLEILFSEKNVFEKVSYSWAAILL